MIVDSVCWTSYAVAAKTKVRRCLGGNRRDAPFPHRARDQALFFFSVSPPPAFSAGEYVLIFLSIGYMIYGPRISADKQTQDANISPEPNE